MLRRSPNLATALLWASALLAPPVAAGPTVVPLGLTVHDAEATHPGYVIYTAGQVKRVILLDADGREVHAWVNPLDAGAAIAENPKPLPDGHILVQLRYPEGPNGEKRKGLAELDWDGNLVWEYFDPDFSFIHHDFHRKPNGNTLILGSEYITRPDIAPYEFKDDIIIEVDREGTVIWEWSTADHFDQLGLSEEGRLAIFNDEYPSLNRAADIFHTNSIQALPWNKWQASDPRFAKNNVLVSQRTTNRVFIIDRETGDIVWRLDEFGTFPDEVELPIGQHHVTLLPVRDQFGNELKGAGRILMFDNGGKAGYPRESRFSSRVLEIQPVAGEIKWFYDGATSGLFRRSFFSMFKSSAERLANNNTLITESSSGRIFEVTRDGRIVWEYINPYCKTKKDEEENVVGAQNHIYRAYKVGLDWPPAGADLTPKTPAPTDVAGLGPSACTGSTRNLVPPQG